MFKHLTLRRLVHAASALAAMSLVAFAASPASAQSGEPIKIGFSMALTGGLAANGKQALLGMQIWEEQINKKGGLLGRPVKLIYYDDQTQPATVPGIYTKLIDVDKVDLVIGPYATNMAAPAMPVIIQKGKVFVDPVRARCERGVQIPEILRDDPDRAEHEAVLHRGLLRCGRAAESEAADRCDRRRGRGIRQQRLRRRAHERQEARLQGRLRPQISAGHDRLHADRAGDPGRQSGPGEYLLVSAGLRSAWCGPSTKSASSRR